MFLNIVLAFPCPRSKRLEDDMTVHLIDTSEVLSCQSWSPPGSSFSLTSHLPFLATRNLVSTSFTLSQPPSFEVFDKGTIFLRNKCVIVNQQFIISNFVYRITRITKMVQPLLPLTFLLCLGIISFCFIAVIIKEFFIDREK